MRDHLVLHINGTRQVVRAPDAFLPLSDFLRRRLGLVGTKIVCSEGDCGACTVLVGRLNPPPSKGREQPSTADPKSAERRAVVFAEGRGGIPASASAPRAPEPSFTYLPVDSCIQFMFQLDGSHVVTVEGLRPDGALNPVQQAMIDCHGSQCGFCTPGFVMAMTGLLEAEGEIDEPNWRRGLTGNLCRCTGYTPILDAALKVCEADHQRLNDLYPPAPILADVAATAADPIELTSSTQRVACPATLDEALAFLAANPDARLIAGATDVGVRTNKSGRLPPTILDLNRVTELDFIRVENNTLIAGARATWTSLLDACSSYPPPSKGGAREGIPARRLNGAQEPSAPHDTHPLLSEKSPLCPEFARILAIFGAPQIRHVGTIGGNIANASPIADSLPFLYVTEATLILASAAGRREVNINNFYHGYKQLDLKLSELIAEVRIPLPPPDETLRLYKVSRRRDLDISTFTAAIRLRLGGEIIETAAIAVGGVGPTVLRARKTEQYLAGQPFTEETMQAAGDLAAGEVTPITDVRGAADYRSQLTRNVLLKFYHQSQPNLAPA